MATDGIRFAVQAVTHPSPMILFLLKTVVSLLLVAAGKVLTMGPGLPEGYEDESGFHFGAARVRRFK